MDQHKLNQAVEILNSEPNVSMRDLARRLDVRYTTLRSALQEINRWSPRGPSPLVLQRATPHITQYSPTRRHTAKMQKIAKAQRRAALACTPHLSSSPPANEGEEESSPEASEGELCCHVCGITEWRGAPFVNIGQIDHIDGNTNNNDISNLRLVCPNCHGHATTRFPSIRNTHPSKTEPLISKRNLIVSENDVLVGEEMQKRYRTQNQTTFNSTFLTKLNNILENSVPWSKTGRLVDRLIATGKKQKRCDCCGITEWRQIPISLFLHGHHKDGNVQNNQLANLEVLCHNCHMSRHHGTELVNHERAGQQATFLTENPMQYNPTHLLVKKVIDLLKSKDRPNSMRDCARTLGVTYKQLKRIAISENLWQPDCGSSRRLNMANPDKELQAQIETVKKIRALEGHTKFGKLGLKLAVEKYEMPKKRYLAIYKHLYEYE